MRNAIKQTILDLVYVSTKFQINNAFGNRLATKAAIVAIRAYRIFLSPFVGNDCLFHPTCSNFAEAAFREAGWTKACIETQQRLIDCAGGYSFFIGPDATVKMRARSGALYTLDQMSSTMNAKAQEFLLFRPKQINRSEVQ